MSSIHDAAYEHLGGGKHEKPKKEIKEVRVRKGKSGGHVIEHHHTHPEHHPMEEHVTKGDDAMAAHMMANMGGTPSPDQDASAAPPDAAAAAGAPAAPAGPVAGAM